jgi:sortase A
VRKLEAVLLVTGLTLLATFFAFRIHSVVATRAALVKFGEVSRITPNGGGAASMPDTTLWDEKRINEYQQSLAVALGDPIAVLNIQRLSLEVPVFNGTDDLVLNRGVGRIIGTAKPGQPGNMGIAGHRDGFFRVLKDIQIGDSIVLSTLNGNLDFSVDKIEIVSPDDVSVLESKGYRALTLVTCYPFYFIGHAPQRYIVHASMADFTGLPDDQMTKNKTTKSNNQEVKK